MRDIASSFSPYSALFAVYVLWVLCRSFTFVALPKFESLNVTETLNEESRAEDVNTPVAKRRETEGFVRPRLLSHNFFSFCFFHCFKHEPTGAAIYASTLSFLFFFFSFGGVCHQTDYGSKTVLFSLCMYRTCLQNSVFFFFFVA